MNEGFQVCDDTHCQAYHGKGNVPNLLLNAIRQTKGKGYGHGLGLSQEGAMEMAREGYLYPEILRFYFPDLFIIDDFLGILEEIK